MKHQRLAVKFAGGLGTDLELDLMARIESLSCVFNLRRAFPGHKDAELRLLYNAVLEKNADPAKATEQLASIPEIELVANPKWNVKPRRIILTA